MTSKTSISSPSEKLSIDKKCNSSTSFTDVTLSKITLRTQKSKRESKKRRLAIVCEEADKQNDSFSFPNEENILRHKTNLNSSNLAKNKKNLKADEIVFKRHIENTGLEAQVKDYYSNSKDEQQINENTFSSSRKKPKKHKKHENQILPKVCEEADSQNDSFSFPNEENILPKEYSSSKNEQQINENTGGSSCKKLKKHRKHKSMVSFLESKNDTVMSSRDSNEKTTQSIKPKNRTVGVILNKSDVEKSAYKMDSPVNTPKDGKPVKRKLSLCQSYSDHNTEHTISDDSYTTNCSTKSLDKRNLFNSHKKFKTKFKSISNEPKTSYLCRENNVDDFMLGENEQLTHFQNQESAELSESILGPKMENSNQSPNTKYQKNETQISQGVLLNTSFMSNKKQKKRRQSSSNLDVNQLSNTLNKNYHCDVNEPNTSEKALVEPCQKYKISKSSNEVFDKNSAIIEKLSNDLDKYEGSQNLPKSKVKQKTLEMRNEFCSKKIITGKEKAKTNKTKYLKAVNISNSAIIDVGKNEKDLINEALNKVSSKSVKNNESIHADGGRINIKQNDSPSTVQINPKTKQKVKRPKDKTNILNKSSCDIDKVQRDLLAAALKSIRSKNSNIANRKPSSPDSNQSPGTKYQENEIQISQVVLSSTSFMSKNKPKKRRQSTSNSEVDQLSTTLNENCHCDVNEHRTNEEALVESCQKDKLSMSSAEVFEKNSTTILSSKSVKNNTLNESIHADSTVIGQLSNNFDEYELSQNLPKTKAKKNILETRNEFCIGKMTTEEEKEKMNKTKNFKAINISNSAILDEGQTEKDLMTEALNKVSSKSVKNNESIHAERGRINIKPIDTHSIVKMNPKTKQKVKQAKTNILLNESSCDIDKVQRDLLAAALKSINKSPRSHKTNRFDKNVKEKKYKKPIKETKKEGKKVISKIIHESAKESRSALQIVQSSNMPCQALSQPCTNHDVQNISKVKSDKNSKPEKVKSKWNQDGTLDIEKFRHQLLAAALKKAKSEPIESQISVNPELHQGNKIKPAEEKKQAKSAIEEKQAKPTKKEKKAKGNEIISKSVKEVKEFKSKTGLKNKLKTKSVRDPFEDFTAKLLSAEIEKRKKGLINTLNT